MKTNMLVVRLLPLNNYLKATGLKWLLLILCLVRKNSTGKINFTLSVEHTETFCIVMAYRVILVLEEFLKGSNFCRVLIYIFSFSDYLCSNLFIF